MKESSSCRIEITRLSLSPFPLCQITTGTRGEKRRDRSRANGNSRKLSSVKIRNSPKALTPIPSPFFLQTRTTFIVKRARARTEDRTSCNHITDSSNGHPRREEKRRRRRLVGCSIPSLNRNAVCHGLKSPQMDPPGKGRVAGRRLSEGEEGKKKKE